MVKYRQVRHIRIGTRVMTQMLGAYKQKKKKLKAWF